jgi:CBS domain-containing protein
MNVQEIMSRPAVWCRPRDTLNNAAQLMWEHDCGSIPVVDDDGSIIGMVTDRDICMAAYTQGAALSAIPVSDAMAKRVFRCRATDSVGAAERLMADHQIRRLPVVDAEERLVGVLSLNDIARWAASSRGANGTELVQTLAAVCRPRAQPSTAER